MILYFLNPFTNYAYVIWTIIICLHKLLVYILIPGTGPIGKADDAIDYSDINEAIDDFTDDGSGMSLCL